MLGQVPLFKFQQCKDYSEQSKPYFEPLTFAWQRFVLIVSILTLFVCIFIEYSYIVWLRFHYNLISSIIRRSEFSLTILETRLSVFAQLLLNLLCMSCYDNKDLCFSSPCIVRANMWSIGNKTCLSVQVVVAIL